jgi:hypothetical protein
VLVPGGEAVSFRPALQDLATLPPGERLMRLFPIAACLAVVSTATLEAQTADQARLMFSVGIGQTSGGGNLWSVGRQPYLITSTSSDTLSIDRRFRRSLDLVLSGTYFPGDHLGFNVEAQLLGLATEDDCRIVSAASAPETASICHSIGRRQRSGSSAALSAGVFYRVASHQPLHPYARVNIGLLVTQQSFIKTSGEDTTTVDFPLATIYEDNNPSSVKPYLSFGGGVVAVIGKGYQLRFELRDNWVQVPRVTGATVRQNLRPPTEYVGKHLLTATIGFDVVLERKRGRRY